jgi:hypothetical protein
LMRTALISCEEFELNECTYSFELPCPFQLNHLNSFSPLLGSHRPVCAFRCSQLLLGFRRTLFLRR